MMGKVKIIHCHSCGKEIASIAANCPYCGVKQIKKKSALPPFLLGVLLTLGFVGGVFYYYNRDNLGVIAEVIPPAERIIPESWKKAHLDRSSANEASDHVSMSAVAAQSSADVSSANVLYEDAICSFYYDDAVFSVRDESGVIVIQAKELPDAENGKQTFLAIAKQSIEYDPSLTKEEVESRQKEYIVQLCHSTFLTDEADTIVSEDVSAEDTLSFYEMETQDGSRYYARSVYRGDAIYTAVLRLCPYSTDFNGMYKDVFDSITFKTFLKPASGTPSQADTTAGEDGAAVFNGTSSSGVSPEFKEWMDTYEAFMNDYIDILEKYTTNPSDLTILTDYFSMLEKYTEYEEKIESYNEETLGAADSAYFVESYSRILKRMGSMMGTASGS